MKITIIGIVHDNTQLAFFGFVDFAETDNIRVLKNLEDLGLVESLATLLLAHGLDVNLLNDRK